MRELRHRIREQNYIVRYKVYWEKIDGKSEAQIWDVKHNTGPEAMFLLEFKTTKDINKLIKTYIFFQRW